MKTGKAPDLNGLTNEYYKCLEDQLLQSIKDIMNGVLYGTKDASNLEKSQYCIITKGESKCLEKKNTYRPISLNNGYKLFAAILGEKLKKVLQLYIHEDQSGFLQKKHLKKQ